MSYPQAEQSEKVVLASLSVYGLPAMEQCGNLRDEMFSLDSHRSIFKAIYGLIDDGHEPHFSAIADRLKTSGKLDSVGGMAYLVDAFDGMNAVKDVAYHAQVVIEKWKLRSGMRICERYGAQFALEGHSDATLSLMQAEVFDVLQERATAKDARIAALTVPALDATLDYTRSAMGMSYGHQRLDEFTMGMQDGEVTIIGARSGVGKSSLMVQAAYANARLGVPVDLFSLEMNEEVVLQRLWALDSGLPFKSIRRKLLNASEQRALKESAYRVAEMPIRIYDDGEMSLSRIAATARLDARRNGMKLFAVDYAQSVEAPGNDEKTRVSAVSKTLTKLAKAEKIHLMLLSQLRKMPVEQYNRPPHVSDLAETRQMENDGHTIILAHRGYDEQASHVSYEGELMVQKQRNGGTGTMQARFNPNSLTFE